jgi:hypothetical protein
MLAEVEELMAELAPEVRALTLSVSDAERGARGLALVGAERSITT